MSKLTELFAAAEAALKKVFGNVETVAEKAVAEGWQFLKNTTAALAKDPVMLATVSAGIDAAIAGVTAAVETGGTAALPAAALSAARSLVISAGGTAEHELVPIVAGEIHAAVASVSQATPEKVNN